MLLCVAPRCSFRYEVTASGDQLGPRLNIDDPEYAVLADHLVFGRYTKDAEIRGPTRVSGVFHGGTSKGKISTRPRGGVEPGARVAQLGIGGADCRCEPYQPGQCEKRLYLSQFSGIEVGTH